MNSDLQLLSSFAIIMLGAVFMIVAYFEAGEFEIEFEEVEIESENENIKQGYREL